MIKSIENIDKKMEMYRLEKKLLNIIIIMVLREVDCLVVYAINVISTTSLVNV